MATFDSVNPARPSEVIGTYRVQGAAQRRWARVPIPARAGVIVKAGEVLLAGKAELAELVSRECGKILIEAGGDVQEAVDMANFVAGQGRAAWGETVPSELGSKLCWTTRAPVGVIGMITPWNFPVAIPSWKIFPALLAGNGVVLKPSEHAPACAEAFVAACSEAGVPEGLIQLVHGYAEPAAALAVHPGVGAVSFTGSVPTGRKVAAAAMETGPRLVSLELGGKNAMVVRPDADLDLVVDGAIFGAFGTSGQRCTSWPASSSSASPSGPTISASATRPTRPPTSAPSSTGPPPSASPAWWPAPLPKGRRWPAAATSATPCSAATAARSSSRRC